MPNLVVSPSQKLLLQAMDTDLDKALAGGVTDGSSTFIAEMVNYFTKMKSEDQLKAREFLTSAAAAMLTSGLITGGGGGSGTVMSVATGDGLSGGPITVSGTIDLLLNSGGGLSKTLGAGNNELGLAAGGVTNAMLANSSLTVTAGAGLTGGGLVSLGGSATLDVGAGTGITVNANDVAIDQTFSPTWSGNHTFSSYIDLGNISTPSAPSSGLARLFAQTNNGHTDLRFLDNDGIVYGLTRDIILRVRNNTGSTIAAGKVVYINGSNGTLPTIALAKADATMTSLPAVGITSGSIAINGFGYVVCKGVVSFDTSGFSAGDTLYVDASTAGGLTNVAPSHPSVEQAVGVVQVSGVGNGSVAVTISPINLHRIDGVNGTSFAVGDGTGTTKSFLVKNAAGTGTLQWNPSTNRTLTLPDATDTLVGKATTDELTNKTLVAMVVKTGLTATGSAANDFSGSTGTFLTSTGAVSLAGNTTVLTGKTFSIADMTLGSILFVGSSGLVTQDNSSLFFDNTNNRLGMGTTTPGVVGGSTDITGSLAHWKSATEFCGIIIETTTTSGKDPFLLMYSSAVDADFAVFVDDSDSQKLKFAMGVINTDTNRNTNTKMTLTQGGNLGIGQTAPSNPLSVNGSASFGTYSATSAPSNSVIISGGLAVGATTLIVSTYAAQLTNNVSGAGTVGVQNLHASGQSQIDIYNNGGVSKMSLGYANTGGDAYLYANNVVWSLQQAGTHIIHMTTGGLIGINSSSPSNQLSVNGAASFGTYASTAAPSNGLIVSGQVGMGTSSPGTYGLMLVQSLASDVPQVVRNTNTTGYSGVRFEKSDGTFESAVGFGNASGTLAFLQSKNFLLATGGVDWIIANTTSTKITFGMTDSQTFMEMISGGSAAVSGSNVGRIRYNSTGQTFQLSMNTSAYDSIALLTATQELTSKTLTAMVVKTGLTASGSASNDFSGSTGTFKTSTGAVTIGSGAISVTGITTFSKFIAPNYAGTSTDVQTPTWTAVSYANSYVDYGGSYGGSQYYKDAMGMVHLRIAAKSGTTTATMFTLPAGFRPGTQLIYWAGVDNAYGNISITTGGAVSSTGGNVYCLMGEIVFTAEA